MSKIISAITSKPLCYAAIGVVGIGAGVGAYFLYRRYRESREEACVDDGYDFQYFVLNEEPVESPDISEEPETAKDGDEKVVAPVFRKPDISDMVDYTKYKEKAGEYDTKSTIADVRNAELTPAPDPDDNPIFQEIDEATYLDSSNGMSKVDATYFTQEKMLAGWNDELKERDIHSTVGTACIRKFDDPEVRSVYVRNLELSIDYEIVRCDDPFEEVLRESLASEE